MNNDLKLFTSIANRLVYLTTRDEYGSSRSKGIETLGDLSPELNDGNILPPSGRWSENSLKLFLSRVRKRYSYDELISECDINFIGRNAWEYASYTRSEEVVQRNRSKKTGQEGQVTASYPISSHEASENELWKSHEIPDLEIETRNIIKKMKNISRH